MGYGIIEVCNGRIVLKEMNVLKLSGKKDNHERLQLIHQKIIWLIKKSTGPMNLPLKHLSLEKMCKACSSLGRAQGVAIAAAMSADLSVTEYSPKKVKQSITGNGNADKDQVWKMLQRLLLLEEKPKHYDATDALAVAICHHFQCNAILNTNGIKKKIAKKKNSWGEFIKKNPSRIKF